MNCPHCSSTATKERTKKTSLGYRTFCCRPFETGKRALHHLSQINYVLSDEGKQGGPGMWMKRTSTSKGNGATSIAPSIGMATWLIRCSVISEIWRQPNAFSSKLPML